MKVKSSFSICLQKSRIIFLKSNQYDRYEVGVCLSVLLIQKISVFSEKVVAQLIYPNICRMIRHRFKNSKNGFLSLITSFFLNQTIPKLPSKSKSSLFSTSLHHHSPDNLFSIIYSSHPSSPSFLLSPLLSRLLLF